MLPTREEAQRLLDDALSCNPGPWGEHSRIAAACAERIARACGLDGERAYILGLLHDIGRKFGIRHLGHVSDGYTYMLSLGYDEAARICLTHSFNNQRIDEYVGQTDTTAEEFSLIQRALSSMVYDDYDRLIQLCDALAGAEGVLDVKERMRDVERRYGFYPKAKWDRNLYLLHHFGERAGRDVYTIVKEDI